MSLLKTYLEDGDAEKCMDGIQCVSLGIEIAQLRANIERTPADRKCRVSGITLKSLAAV
jgi:hypothetical protein